MHASELLHYAFLARDPLALGEWYADLFDGQFFLHPVMSGLGIVIVKLNHPEAVFQGLLEFWPWDVVWDGETGAFRKIEAQPSPTSYGHLAVLVPQSQEALVAELIRRQIPYRIEPRGPGLAIPVIDDPEGNMIELFANVAHVELPHGALCPREQVRQHLAMLRGRLEERVGQITVGSAVPLLLFEANG